MLSWTAFLAVHYSLVVRWEEAHLSRQLGGPYDDYLARVPRWIPRPWSETGGDWSAAEVLVGERSTWLATGAVMALLAARGAWLS